MHRPEQQDSGFLLAAPGPWHRLLRGLPRWQLRHQSRDQPRGLRRSAPGAVLILLLGLAGCSHTNQIPDWSFILWQDDGSFPRIDAKRVAGSLAIAGSSTMMPLLEYAAVALGEEGFDGSVSLESVGSLTGFSRWAAGGPGAPDIAAVSTSLDSAARALVPEDGLRFDVGADRIVIAVSRRNDFANSITLDEAALLFGSARTWADIRSDWPSFSIQRFVPGIDSGTFEVFRRVVMNGDAGAIVSATDVQLSEDDNRLVNGVAGSPSAVGFFGHSYLQGSSTQLRTVDISTPSGQGYPLDRRLSIYLRREVLRTKPQVAAFVHQVLDTSASTLQWLGFFPLSDAERRDARSLWMEVLDGLE